MQGVKPKIEDCTFLDEEPLSSEQVHIQQGQGDHLTRIKVSLAMFFTLLQAVIYQTKQSYDKIYRGHENSAILIMAK